MEDIEIIIPCMGRLEHLKQSLPLALAQKASRCIVVDYSCPEHCGDWVEAHEPKARVVRITGQQHFNLSTARNAGALAGTAPWLFFLDADTLLEPDFTENIRPLLETDSFFSLSKDGRKTVGSCLIPRAAFESLGGYDEIYQGWGQEDIDLNRRLGHEGLKHRLVSEGLAAEIDHDDSSRIENYEVKEKDESNLINWLYGRAKFNLELLQRRPMDILRRQQLYSLSKKAAATALDTGKSDIFLHLEKKEHAGMEINRLLHYHIDSEPGRWQPGESSYHPAFTAALKTIRDRWPDLNVESTEEPLFLLSAGFRSGSTLLQRMMMKERWMWGEPYGRSGLIDNLSLVFRSVTEEWPRDQYLENHPRYNAEEQHLWIANLYPDPQHLVSATLQYLRALFAEPAKAKGFPLWGFKDVTLDNDMAFFLKWLYPRGRFIFLIRNPYFAYRSFRRFKDIWYRRWPNQAISSPEQFGAMWLRLAQGFLSTAEELGAKVLRYEDITSPEFDWAAVEQHIGHAVDKTQLESRITGHRREANPVDPSTLNQELFRLSSVVHGFASSIGYWLPTPSDLRE